MIAIFEIIEFCRSTCDDVIIMIIIVFQTPPLDMLPGRT